MSVIFLNTKPIKVKFLHINVYNINYFLNIVMNINQTEKELWA